MSLVRLLTAGKCFVGLKESANRYRVTSQRLLPKFESQKNPFGVSPKAEPGHISPKPAAIGPPPAINSAAPVPTMSAPASQAPAAKQKSKRAKLAQLGKLCISSFKPLWPSRSGTKPKPVVPRPTKTMVQAELSLEKVRVVRNDLSDSDVEIVTVKATQPVERSKAQNPEPSAAAGLIPPGKGPGVPRLANLAGRLFGAGKR